MPGVRFDQPWRDDGAGLAVTPDGALALVDGDAEVRQALMLLLSTRPGERVMRPDYGCPLHRLAFSPLDSTTEGLAIHYVREAIEQWEPRVAIDHLDAGPGEEPASLEILLTYTVRASARPGDLVFAVNLDGEDT